MKYKANLWGAAGITVICAAIWILVERNVSIAHCDRIDGPVITAAKASLEKGDVTPVLKWVKQDYEKELRAAFNKALSVRKTGANAKELADMYFFETLVRLHRAGEGAPYTGIKPADTPIEPPVTAADKALETGSVDGLVKMISDAVSDGLKDRFAAVVEKKKHADESVDAGREYVEAYVEFVHYAERLYNDASSSAHAGHGEAHEEPKEEHQHK